MQACAQQYDGIKRGKTVMTTIMGRETQKSMRQFPARTHTDDLIVYRNRLIRIQLYMNDLIESPKYIYT